MQLVALLAMSLPAARLAPAAFAADRHGSRSSADAPALVTLFLCGDVMTGRGMDQILPHPSKPELYEPWVRNALDYLRLAEAANGPIPRPAAFSYPWGIALAELERRRPDVRIVNLETAVTAAGEPWPKGINYRMHPANAPCLTVAGIDCCVLSNNHVLDWGRQGLADTLAALGQVRIKTAGAAQDLQSAQAPAILETRLKNRVLLFAAATADCGVPPEWAAGRSSAGVHLLPDLSQETLRLIAANVRQYKRPGDLALFSIHWGGNWGYPIPPEQRDFAHGLIDDCGIDLLHGHSAHHVKAIEVYRGRLLLYGCGDFLNDYEGIGGHDEYRGELGLMYFPRLDCASGRLDSLEMTPTLIRRFRLERPHADDRRWLLATLRRECKALGSGVEERADGTLALRWS